MYLNRRGEIENEMKNENFKNLKYLEKCKVLTTSCTIGVSIEAVEAIKDTCGGSWFECFNS